MTNFPTEPWAVAKGEYDGRPMFVRINTGAAAIAGRPGLRHRLGIAVPLQHADSDGLPTGDEISILAELETRLLAELGDGLESVLVLVITTSGMREFVLYTQLVEAAREAVGRVAATTTSHALQFIEEDDPEWSVYAEFAQSRGETGSDASTV